MHETILEKYQKRLNHLQQEFAGAGATVNGLWVYQELQYRVSVLETIQMYERIAPVSNEMKVLVTHYQMLNTFVQGLVFERQYGVPIDEKDQKHRQAAHLNLSRVVEDYRKRFSSFVPGTPEDYKNEISRIIITLLPAWIQYRNVYVSLKQTEEA